MTPTTETPQATTETPPANDSGQAHFPGIEETKREVAQIGAAPPSPMPLPVNMPSRVDAPAADASASSAKPKYKGKDYKGREFDPRFHRVKADGSPDYNVDGTLKILPKSKQGISERVKSFFSIPPSDHERAAEDQAAGEAQARSIAEREELEASAEFLKEAYFFGGEMLAGAEFVNFDAKNREEKIRRHFMRYEEATGRSYEPPAWAVLLIGLGLDFKRTVAAVPECQEHFEEIKSGVAEKAVSGFIGNSWIGKRFSSLMFWKRKPKSKKSGDVLKPRSQFSEGEESE